MSDLNSMKRTSVEQSYITQSPKTNTWSPASGKQMEIFPTDGNVRHIYSNSAQTFLRYVGYKFNVKITQRGNRDRENQVNGSVTIADPTKSLAVGQMSLTLRTSHAGMSESTLTPTLKTVLIKNLLKVSSPFYSFKVGSPCSRTPTVCGHTCPEARSLPRPSKRHSESSVELEMETAPER
jgi:hypothetical protein